MGAFPVKWTAEDVSLFCFDRRGWAMLVPLFGWLFGEVTQKIEAKPDALVKFVESVAFGNAAKAHHGTYDMAAHPYELVKGFGAPESWPVA